MARFKSTERYVASRDLEVAVNAAVTLQRPLLVKGEPGTGKTVLAYEVAMALGLPLIEWHIKSTTKHSRAFMSTTPSPGCVTGNSAIRACTTSPTTSFAASCGMLSSPTSQSWS